MNTKTHRHFVALPLLVVSLGVVVGLNTIMTTEASRAALIGDATIVTKESTLDWNAGWLLVGRSETNTSLKTSDGGESATVRSGQVLLKTAGSLTVDVGYGKVHALKGSLVILRDSTSVTVVALSAPVIVTHADDVSVLAPGMQAVLKGDAPVVSTVPADWYADQMTTAKVLHEADIPSDANDQSILAQLLSMKTLTTDDVTHARTLADTIDATGEAARLVFFRILSHDDISSDLRTALSDWMTNDDVITREALSLLPSLVAGTKMPVSAAAIELWQKTALSAALSETHKVLALVHTHARLPGDLERAGYPKQAQYWRDALMSVMNLLSAVAPDAQVALDADRALLQHGSEPAAPIAVEPILAKPTTHWSGKELQALAWQILVENDALLTQDTSYTPDVESQTVHVTGVFIAESGSDIPYEFTIDLSGNRVIDIVRDGVNLPNAVPVENFFH